MLVSLVPSFLFCTPASLFHQSRAGFRRCWLCQRRSLLRMPFLGITFQGALNGFPLLKIENGKEALKMDLDDLDVDLELLNIDGVSSRVDEEIVKTDEDVLKMKMLLEAFPKLPIYRSKGIWIDEDDGPRRHAIIWAFNHWSSASENTLRFILNAVAAVFDFQLIKHCSEECSDEPYEEPCEQCGRWEWVTDPLSPELKSWMAESNLFERSKNPLTFITKESTRCAASMIVATKADFWSFGPIDLDFNKGKELIGDSTGMRKEIKLGKYATSMLKALYPGWSIEDASNAVIVAGLWANTNNILMMNGNSPLSKCVPILGLEESEIKINLGPEMKKAFESFPAGTEDLMMFLRVAKQLIKSPLIIYFPNVMDLEILVKAINCVKKKPFHYHKSAEEMGLEPMNENNFYSLYGRLGAFYLADALASQNTAEDIWDVEKIRNSNDYAEGFSEICKAYLGLEKISKAAIILLKARPVIHANELMAISEMFEIGISTTQKEMLEL